MQITCPNCGKIIEVDPKELDSVIKQIRDNTFHDEVSQQVNEAVTSLNEKHRIEQESMVLKARTEEKAAADKQIEEAKNKVLEADAKIKDLLAKLEVSEKEKQMAVMEAVQKVEREKDQLTAKLETKDRESELEKSEIKAKYELELKDAVKKIEDEKNQLNNELLTKEKENQIAKAEMQAQHDLEMKRKEDELEYYKDLKLRSSTKMVGESLERHCEDDYNMHLRPLLPNAYFEKDNMISETGSKGDFIFRESLDGTELLSIMFEMKNEMDTTEKKHKNEYFFKELDKDRREKGCEYAVLVSLLESDSEYYNQGIVNVSHKYEKMYVIRPQNLCLIITMLRDMALNSHSYRKELQTIKNQNIDVSNFEDELAKFKDAFGKNCLQTSKRFQDAIAQIDKSIKDLEKVKEALTLSEKHMNSADNKLQDLTVKQLTKNSPLMREKFDEVRNNKI